jgi:RNA polymerase sigma factor (sigma-70 family)
MDLESTVARLAPDLLRFCTGLTRNPVEGEEIAQEALASLVRYWRAHGPPESPSAFAYTVARRQAFRLHRRLRRLLPLDLLDAQPHPGPSPEAEAIQRRELEDALRALGALSLKDREALLLAADGELGVEEAARIAGIRPSAFKMRVHRARQRLCAHLEQSHEIGEPGREEARAGS